MRFSPFVFSKPTAAVQIAITYAWSKGVVIVAAAGNNYSTDPKYPAAGHFVRRYSWRRVHLRQVLTKLQ